MSLKRCSVREGEHPRCFRDAGLTNAARFETDFWDCTRFNAAQVLSAVSESTFETLEGPIPRASRGVPKLTLFEGGGGPSHRAKMGVERIRDP
jgi:hypothetical protein